MKNKHRRAILLRATNTWGVSAQSDMCVEEMSELVKALSKFRRYVAKGEKADLDAAKIEEYTNDIREEIADVQIMLDQMRIIFGETHDIEVNKLEKLKRRLKETVLNADTDAAALQDFSELIQSGNVRNTYEIGETVVLCGENYTIIGFNHDKDADKPELNTVTVMAERLLSARAFHDGECKDGWRGSDLRKWLNEEYYNELPAALKKHIRPVVKVTHDYEGSTYTTIEKLFVPSESELFGSAIWSDYEDGERYEAFENRHIRKRCDENGNYNWYWTRSARGGNSARFCTVGRGGGAGGGTASNAAIRVPLCFTIA